MRALQEDEKLRKENYLLRVISKQITEKIKNREIWFSKDFLDFIGSLEFDKN